VVKRKVINELIQKEKVEFIAIQETKLEVIYDALCYSICGSEDCQWISGPAIGNSGGFLSIWSKFAASLIFSFSGDNFIGVCLDWGELKKRCFIVNVYSKCDISCKRLLLGESCVVEGKIWEGSLVCPW
jgi:hypothetical protein